MKTNLLSQSNLKLEKNDIPTWGLSLMPEKRNSQGINLCEFSTKACRNSCIVDSGNARFEKVNEARLRKTDFFLSEKEQFLKQLWAELNYLNTVYKQVLIRLNMYSDIDWNQEFSSFGYDLTKLESLIFYGYTKSPKILDSSASLNNFDLVFSFSGYNWALCSHYLDAKICNISIVFKLKKGEKMPTTYKGYEVINGDESDQRLKSIEGTGKIIALSYKSPVARGKDSYKPSKFVIEL